MLPFGSWSDGLWGVRLFGRMLHLRASWKEPLFSERYRHITILPLGKGWRITIRKAAA